MSFTLPSSSTNLDPASSAPGNESRKRKRAQSEAPVESPSVDHVPKRSRQEQMVSVQKSFADPLRDTVTVAVIQDNRERVKKLTSEKSKKRSERQPLRKKSPRRVTKTLSEGDVIGEKSKEGTEAWCEQSQKTDTLLEIPKWLLETRDQVRKDELLVKHMNSILSMSTPLEMPETIKEESEDE